MTTRGQHALSLLLEFGGLLGLGVALGYASARIADTAIQRQLDLDPSRLPAPLLTVDGNTTLIGALVAAAAVAAATLLAQLIADRAEPAIVLRAGLGA